MAKKHKIRGFFVGEKGQRTFNYAYNIGASIVILGALFKVLHLPGADMMLILGMGTEACIFFLSAFDEPAKDYKWEKVYPELDMPNSEEAAISRLERMREGVSDVSGVSGVSGVPAGGVVIIGNGAQVAASDGAPVQMPTSVPAMGQPMPSMGQPVPVMGQSVPSMPDMSPALAQMGTSLENLQESLKGLEHVPEFAHQLEELNKNVQGLNAIYSLQLKSVSAGLGSIEQINQKNQELANNLQQLNEAYSRMIAAMSGK